MSDRWIDRFRTFSFIGRTCLTQEVKLIMEKLVLIVGFILFAVLLWLWLIKSVDNLYKDKNDKKK